VMIGEMISGLFPKSGMLIKLSGVVAGSVLFRMLLGWTLSIGIDPIYMKLVVACFVLLVVGIPNLRKTT
ncbi:MAG: ABC transporter permease, partial [Bacteroidota bacterium]